MRSGGLYGLDYWRLGLEEDNLWLAAAFGEQKASIRKFSIWTTQKMVQLIWLCGIDSDITNQASDSLERDIHTVIARKTGYQCVFWFLLQVLSLSLSSMVDFAGCGTRIAWESEY